MFRSIKFRAFIGNFVVIITLIVLLTSLIYNRESKKLVELAKNNSQLVTEIYAEQVGTTIIQHVYFLEFLAESNDAKQLNMAYIYKQLNQMRHREKSLFINTFYIGLNGNYSDSVGPLGSIVDREYYRQLIEEESSYIISEAIVSKSLKEPIILIVVPIFDNDKVLVGAVAGSIKLSSLSKELETIKYLGESYGWIIENSGMIIAHPDPEIPTAINVLTADLSNYKGLTKIGESMVANEHGSGEYYDLLLEKAKILTFESIPFTPGWKLAITSLKEDIFTSLSDLLRMITTVSIIVIILSLVFSILNSKRIIRPLLMLTDAVRESEKRNFAEIKLNTNLHEISHLVNAYNKMTISLENYTTNLELMVANRTKELEDLNTQLDTHNQNLNNRNQELYSLATIDELTGLLNRSHLFKQLEIAKNDVMMHIINCFSILFIDLDNFKYYNDTFGHDIGDKILINFSTLLMDTFRGTDIICRYGGDEFIVILPNTNSNKSFKVSKKLKNIIRNMDGYSELIANWSESSIEIPVNKMLNLSIGISTFNTSSSLTIKELIKEADANMYHDKKSKVKR